MPYEIHDRLAVAIRNYIRWDRTDAPATTAPDVAIPEPQHVAMMDVCPGCAGYSKERSKGDARDGAPVK